jgi:hypothetical protein
MKKLYIQHEGKVIATVGSFKYLMAITLDPATDHTRGIIRCITSRESNVQIKGYTDRSELYAIKGNSLEHFEMDKPLIIQNEKEVIRNLMKQDDDFIGLEDPDIWIDKTTGLMHIYFTIPIKPSDPKEKIKIHLGHAQGKNLDSLEMTAPVLSANEKHSAKEVSIAPINSKGFRYNLVESRDRQIETTYSIVQVAIAHDMGKSWEYGEIVFHPAQHKIPWIAGHASPGPLLPKSFIDLGKNKLLGIMNGREANKVIDGKKVGYGMFSIGLFIYDYENGKIDWVSSEPFIQDSEAITITFASQFVETNPGEGILYAHVDDSFVRAYTLKAEWIKELLPKL